MRVKGSKNKITKEKVKKSIWKLLNQAHNLGFDTINILEEILQEEKEIKSLSKTQFQNV